MHASGTAWLKGLHCQSWNAGWLLQMFWLLLQLVDEAYQRWLVEEEGVVDDITAVVVKFIHAEA